MSDQTQTGIEAERESDPRLEVLIEWLCGIIPVTRANLQPASVDASFRRYFRVKTERESFIVMDAPPERESCLPFMRIAGYLERMGLNAPRVIEANPEEGFLLLSDLGFVQYFDVVPEDFEAAQLLYADALAALHTLQRRGTEYQSSLPPYDEKLLRFELSIFKEWLYETHLGLKFTAEEAARWQRLCDLLVDSALSQPRVFVHRDFHSRNLMVMESNNPGILDFQDALEGPLTYDLVSLLKDCYVRLPPSLVREWSLSFYEDLDGSIKRSVGREQFVRHFDLTGVQRHLKAAGIFARLNHRDGKPGYLADIPRTLGYVVELAPYYDQLSWIAEIINARCLPALEEAL